MRLLGILIVIGTLLFMGYNIYMSNVCLEIANDHPVITLASEGQNLPNNGNFYTFRSPLSEVEIGTYVALGVGVLMILFGGSKKEAPATLPQEKAKS